jgi:hypothetical protein
MINKDRACPSPGPTGHYGLCRDRGPWLKTVVLNGVGKGVAKTASGVGREDERWAEKPSAD